MSSKNPYIQDSKKKHPTSKYTITFIDEHDREHIVEVDPERIPYDEHGEPGSLLEIALGHEIGLDHACGGVCSCSTCHVIVEEGFDSCNPATEAEEDQLDMAYDLTDKSRLACQCVPDGTKNLRVVVPTWNRNLVSE